MNKLSITAISQLLAVFVLLSSSAYAECKIYTDADFKGREGIVQNGDLVRFNPEGTRDTTLVPTKVREFRDASWENQISSVQVSDKCEAIFWNKQGQHDRFKTTAQLPENYDNPALGILCECK